MKNSDRGNRFDQLFNPNSQNIFTLPLNGKIINGRVIVTGTITVTDPGGGAAGVVAGEGGPANLIRRIKVRTAKAVGSRYPDGLVVDCSPRSLLNYAIFQRSKKVVEQAGSVLGSGVAGSYTIYMSIPIYFGDSENKRQVETALNADPTAYQSITVEVDTGTLTDCFTGNTMTANFSALHVQWADDRENFAGDTYVLVQEEHDQIINATASRQLDNAMPRDGSFLQWLIMSEATAARTLSDALLNRVTLAGVAIDYDKYAKDIRQQMLDDSWIDPSQTSTGLYFIDFTDGMLTGAITAQDLQAKFDVNNISGAGLDSMKVFTRRLFSPAQYNASRGKGAAKNA